MRKGIRRDESAPEEGWKRRAAVLAVTAALGGSALLGVAAPMEAMAAESGTVTIHPAEGNKLATYKAYRLFTADIKADNTVRGIAWDASVSEEAQDSIVAKLDELTQNGYSAWVSGKGEPKMAQNVFEFMSLQIAGSEASDDVHNQKVVDSGTFAMDFATWLAYESGIEAVNSTVTAGQAFTSDEGYYLFVSTGTAGTVATSPIWFPLGGSANEVFEKASVPTVDKTMVENGKDDNAGSAQIGEEISFKVKATLPSNYGSYATYKMVITDTPVNMEIVRGSVKVEATTDITAAESIEYTDNGMKVTVNDLKAADQAATRATNVVVTYKAKLTDAALNTPGSNKNSVSYEYSSNPGASSQMGSASDSAVPVYSFLLDLTKKDESTDAALDGAKFIIKNEQGMYYDAATKTWTLDEDAAKAAPLATVGGKLAVMGLDEGTFELTEVEAPEGYELPVGEAARVTLFVTPVYENGSLKNLTVKATGAMIDAQDGAAADVQTGVVSVVAQNDKNVTLAMTGAEGVGMAGAGVVALGLVWYAMRARRDRADQR